MSQDKYLPAELALDAAERVVAQTKFGPVRGRRALNGAAVWLEVPYALPPGRFQDPQPLPREYRYEDKEYIAETSYPVQPLIDGQAAGKSTAGVSAEDKLGRGQPTENCLFLNITCPRGFPSASGLPVKVYIHGGFLQFGCPHSKKNYTHFASNQKNEIWINIAYRLSIFGFLACDEPRIDGNYGFKDQWMALEWVKDNIAAFGGNPDNIQVVGLSAGAHSVHQLLHHASHLPKGQSAPFTSAFLQSNAILSTSKSLSELRPQFHALCEGLGLDPSSPDILETLRDPVKVPASVLTELIDSEKLGMMNSFRNALDGTFLPLTPDPMEWQRSGGLGRKLKEKGVKSVCIGELSEEWFVYATSHPINGFADMKPNLERYYLDDVVEGLLESYEAPSEGGDEQARAFKLFGDILCDGQAYLPIRILHRDLANAGVPVLRYEIRWAPEQLRINGYVTHACDRVIWTYRQSDVSPEQLKIIGEWLDIFYKELQDLDEGKPPRKASQVLTLKEDKTIAWVEDPKWDRLMNKLRLILPGEKELGSSL